MAEEQKIVTDSAKAWLLAARPKTLSGAAVPVMIGMALAYSDAAQYGEGTFSWVAALLCLLFAFAMQIDANFINDFFDFVNGTDDAETRLGPRRACAQGWVKLDSMKKAIALTTCIACVIGLPLVYYGGFEMVLVGMICVLFAFLYTTWFSYQGLGDLLVLVFFGLVPVCCTYYIQLHEFTWELVLASIACGLVIDALDFQAEDRLTPRWHVGQPCGKASWESLVGSLEGKPRGKATDPLIHAKGSVTLLLKLGRKSHVHGPTCDED